jgi:hypothetical protein
MLQGSNPCRIKLMPPADATDYRALLDNSLRQIRQGEFDLSDQEEKK